MPLTRRSLLGGVAAGAIASTAKLGFDDQDVTSPVDQIGDGDDAEFLDVGTLRSQYLDYLTNKAPEIEEQKEARRYYHGAQLTDAERRVLDKRGQPPVIINAIAKKINRIVGLTERVHYDPKAFPRNPQGEAGADIATESVRYALDENDWKTRDAECVRQCGIEGVAGIEFKLVPGDQGAEDPDIGVQEVLGEDYFYDFRSVRFDFSDKRYEGVGKWVDVEVAVELFPKMEGTIRGLIENGSDLSTYADREFRWVNTASKRVRLVEHWYKHKGKWCWCFYISHTVLDEGVSPFYDKKNQTISRFVMWRAAVDHDGDSYGFFRNLKSLQDEKNQRRSRALFISNSRRLIADKGAVDDVETARREWARPDGYIEKNPGKEISPDNTQFDLSAQLEFLKLTNEELAEFANVDAATMTGGAVGNLSGYAISLLQQPGLAEIGWFLLSYRGWKLRVYEAIWCAQQRYWTAERWIRVTGDEEMAQWLQVNGMELDEHGRPALVNFLGAIDVNFKFDEGPDTPNTMADIYEVVKNDPTVPVQVKIELMPINSKRKKKILAMMQPPVDPAEAIGKKLTLEGMAASNEVARGIVEKDRAIAVEKRAKAFADVVGAAVDAAHFGLDAAGAAQTYQLDAPTVPVERPPEVIPSPVPPPPAPPGPMPPMPAMAPPAQYSLPL